MTTDDILSNANELIKPGKKAEEPQKLFIVSLIGGSTSALLTSAIWAAISIRMCYLEDPTSPIGFGAVILYIFAPFVLPTHFLNYLMNGKYQDALGLLFLMALYITALVVFAVMGSFITYYLAQPSAQESQIVAKIGTRTGLVDAFVLYGIEFFLTWYVYSLIYSPGNDPHNEIVWIITLIFMFVLWGVHLALFEFIPPIAKRGSLQIHKYLKTI